MNKKAIAAKVTVAATLAASAFGLVGIPAFAAPSPPSLSDTTAAPSAGNQLANTSASAPASCQLGYLCLYDGQYYTGRVLPLRTCGNYGLERWSYPAGGSWRDKSRSIFNNQTGGADSVFYDTRNGSRVWVGSLEHPPSGFRTLTSNADKKIDFVHVC